jgi:hypothetical protein
MTLESSGEAKSHSENVFSERSGVILTVLFDPAPAWTPFPAAPYCFAPGNGGEA